MNKSISLLKKALLALAIVAAATAAAAPKLKVGDPAPTLQVSKWVQGDPVAGFDKDKVYVVEFWATWCGPCKVSIPHLNELHNQLKDKGVVFIGQDVMEEEAEKDVPKFVRGMGTNMTYRVALDDKSKDKDGAMSATWMQAAEQGGIPTAFVVDKKGSVVWIGHPMELEEAMLLKVVAGTFDEKAAAAEHAEKERKQAAIGEAGRKLGQAMESKNWDEADAAVAELDKLLPPMVRGQLEMVRMDILFGKKDMKGGYALATKIGEKEPEGSPQLNQLAWKLATDEGLEPRDLNLAETLILKALKGDGAKDASILDTKARIQFLKGDKEGAVKTEEEAVKLAGDRLKSSLEKTLNSYKEGKVPKE